MAHGKSNSTGNKKANLFGSDVPFAEPGWYRGVPSPFYNESHVALRNRVRQFVDTELMPYVDEWEEAVTQKGQEVDMLALAKKAVAAGIFAPQVSEKYGGTPLPGGVEFDPFHDLIWIDELSRVGASGLIAGITMWTMSLPPILKYASEEIKEKVAKPVLRGEKVLSLCITEPYAGSDVSNLQTTATKTPDGKYYMVSGQKKWITMGAFASFFTVAVRTGGQGGAGVSILLVERDMPGVSVRRMKLQGNWAAGTAIVTFDDVKVPVENLIGEEGKGFKMLLNNLQHERLVIGVQAIRQSRLCIEDSIQFARQRKTFGKRLIDHQVIRHKIAEMARLTEATWAMAENLAYQMKAHVDEADLAGPMALFKVMCSKSFELCAREASQILGGASYTREGKGARVERLYREVRSYAIPGGSEEILMDT